MDKQILHRYRTCTKAGHINPQNLLSVSKNCNRVPLTKCSAATFEVIRLSSKQQIDIYIR